MKKLTESIVEQAALTWPESLGWRVTHSLDITPGVGRSRASGYAQVVPEARLRDALIRLNPALLVENDAEHWAL